MSQEPTQPVRKNASDANKEPVWPNSPTEPDEAAKAPLFEQPDHSMHEEEPDGWDLAPTDIHDPKMKRHSRKEGKGGTPDPGDRRPRRG